VKTEFGKTFKTMILAEMEFRFVCGALESKLLLIGGPLIPVNQILQRTAEALNI